MSVVQARRAEIASPCEREPLEDGRHHALLKAQQADIGTAYLAFNALEFVQAQRADIMLLKGVNPRERAQRRPKEALRS